MHPDPGVSPSARSPEDKLVRNIEQLSYRILRGMAALQNGSVRLHRFLSVGSIVLSFAAGAGLIGAKISPNIPQQSGWAFWGSIALLGFGILSQAANQFQVGRRASDAESLAVRCGVYKERLKDMLLDEDPRTAVSALLVEVGRLFQSDRYNIVLPTETQLIRDKARVWAQTLVSEHRRFWKLKVIRQRPRSRLKVLADPSRSD